VGEKIIKVKYCFDEKTKISRQTLASRPVSFNYNEQWSSGTQLGKIWILPETSGLQQS